MEQIQCRIDIGDYQLDNDEYHLRAFDFPVILLNQPVKMESGSQLTYHLEDLLLMHSEEREYSAMKINICLKADKYLSCGKSH